MASSKQSAFSDDRGSPLPDEVGLALSPPSGTPAAGVSLDGEGEGDEPAPPQAPAHASGAGVAETLEEGSLAGEPASSGTTPAEFPAFSEDRPFLPPKDPVTSRPAAPTAPVEAVPEEPPSDLPLPAADLQLTVAVPAEHRRLDAGDHGSRGKIEPLSLAAPEDPTLSAALPAPAMVPAVDGAVPGGEDAALSSVAEHRPAGAAAAGPELPSWLVSEDAGSLCSRCETVNAAGAKYCINCGMALFDHQVAVDARRCPRCLAAIGEGAQYCPGCGLPVHDGQVLLPLELPEEAGTAPRRPLWRRVLGLFLAAVAWLLALVFTLALVGGGTSAAVWFFGYAQAVDNYSASIAPILVETEHLDRELGVSRPPTATDVQTTQAQLDAFDIGLRRIAEQSARVSATSAPAFLITVAVSLTQSFEYRKEALIYDRSAYLAQTEATMAGINASFYHQMAEWYYAEYLWTGSSRSTILDQYRFALEKEKVSTEQAGYWQQLASGYEARRAEAQQDFSTYLAYSRAELERLQKRPEAFEQFLQQLRIVVGI